MNKILLKVTLKIAFLLILVFISDASISGLFLRAITQHYELNKSSQLLFVGHSSSEVGIDPAIVEQELGIPVVKFTYGGTNVFDRDAMIKFYFGKHPGSVKWVAYDVDFCTFFPTTELTPNSYKNLYPFMDAREIDEYMATMAKTYGEYVSKKWVKVLRYDAGLIAQCIRVLMGKKPLVLTNKVGKEIENTYLSKNKVKNKLLFNVDAYICLQNSIQFILDHGAKVILFKSPLPDFVIEHNVNHEFSSRAISEIERTFQKNVLVLDSSRIFAAKHDLFNDPLHLNQDGRILFSRQLSKDIANWIKVKGYPETSP